MQGGGSAPASCWTALFGILSPQKAGHLLRFGSALVLQCQPGLVVGSKRKPPIGQAPLQIPNLDFVSVVLDGEFLYFFTGLSGELQQNVG